MTAWLAWLVAFAFCAAVFSGTNWILRVWSDRRWARMQRDLNRRELRYRAWAQASRIGGWR
jgi:hypothetical protein